MCIFFVLFCVPYQKSRHKAVIIIVAVFHVGFFIATWTVACQAPLSSTISWSLLRFISNESVMPSNHLILCHPSPSAFSLSWHQRLFQWDACFIFKNKMKINKIKAQPVKTVHINNRPREGMFYQITTVFNGELKGAASTHTNYCSWDSVNSFFICSIKRKRNVEIIGHSFSRKKDSNSAFLHPENSMWFHSITLVLLITFVTGAMVQRD